jgi:rhamnopyranosyl-N-acetylglucosaminyl-diphospho-decaprenol beta-1,3/1,4-galactofuranosyltransferase
MKNTTAVVVVTFNRKQLLMECLESLRNQTQKPDSIYIIDNASTDGTSELLLNAGYISAVPPESITENIIAKSVIVSHSGEKIEIVYVRKKCNDGGSGGFHEGMKLAYESGNEWIWVMDDDVKAVPDALEILSNWKQKSLVIQPSRIYENKTEMIWAGSFTPETGLEYHSQNFNKRLKNMGYVYVNIACFEGMFIHRTVIEKAGLPDKRFFFCGDDTMYGFKVSQVADIILIKDILLIREIFKAKKDDNILSVPINMTGPMTSYYLIRNEYLKMSILEKDGFDIDKKTYKRRIRISILKELGKAVLTFNPKWAKSTWQGYKDGKSGYFDRTYIH